MYQPLFWFFLVLLYHQTAVAVHQNSVEITEIRDENSSPTLNDRVLKLEAKDRHQEEEISFLKTTVHELRGQIEHLEAAAEESSTDGVITGPAKRPARLLPLRFLRYLRILTTEIYLI